MTSFQESLTQSLIRQDNNREEWSGTSAQTATGLEKDCRQCPKQNDCSAVKIFGEHTAATVDDL